MDEYRSILQEFFSAGVRFLVVGGYATIAHGYTRATDDLEVPFLGLRDLIRNKTAVGRHKDLADVEGLMAFHRLKNRELP